MVKELYLEVLPFPDMTKEFFGYDVYSCYHSNSNRKPRWELWARFWGKESDGVYSLRSKIIRVDSHLKTFRNLEKADFFLHKEASKFARRFNSHSLEIYPPFFYNSPVSIVSVKD
jgi:hypothetical protein